LRTDLKGERLGKRPYRVHVDPTSDGAEVTNIVLDRVRVELLRRIGRCGSRNRRVPPPPPRFLDKVSETLEIGPDFGFRVGGFLGGGGVFWGWVLSSRAGWVAALVGGGFVILNCYHPAHGETDKRLQ
jgi:hypothetical protein